MKYMHGTEKIILYFFTLGLKAAFNDVESYVPLQKKKCICNRYGTSRDFRMYV